MDGNTRKAIMEDHLLFHKALTEDSDAFNRIGGYIDILDKAESGEMLNDPTDEAIRSIFSLVLENGIDPWEIDLEEFARTYSEKVSRNMFDMIVAGKLVLMAWRILRLQSEVTRSRVDESEPEEMDDTFMFEEEDKMFVPEVSFMEAFRRDNIRPVTMYELLDAFEEARAEIGLQSERERIRLELKAREPKRFEDKAHEEDDEKDVERVYDRIRALDRGAFLLSDLYVSDIMYNLRLFMSVLHLVRDGRLRIWQDVLPTGGIFIEMMAPGMALEEMEAVGVS